MTVLEELNPNSPNTSDRSNNKARVVHAFITADDQIDMVSSDAMVSSDVKG